MKALNYHHFTENPKSTLHNLLTKLQYDQFVFLVDENTKKNCLPYFDNTHSVIEIPSGEKNKTLQTCEAIWDQLTVRQFSRKSLLVNLGGGVIGDMGGFVAATYKRGIDFINIPTTLLAMVDASIGGKLAVDFKGFKNHIGVFQNPKAVIIFPNFIHTLPQKQILSGFAEIVKHGLIWDKEYWHVAKNLAIQKNNWSEIIKKSILIKQAIVNEDPTEAGVRKILNFGHTLGHAIESYFLNSPQPLLHGEAIGIGMYLESLLSFQKGLLCKEEKSEIEKTLKKHYFFPHLPSLDDLLPLLYQDKKNEGQAIRCSLLKAIGSCSFDVEVSIAELDQCLAFYEKSI